jgi:long-chain acyl-CoA synthetase
VSETSRGIYLRFERIAREHGKHRALIVGDRAWSYSELLNDVQRCAAGLRRAGVQWGDGVVVALPNSPELVVAAFATFAVGGVLAPLNPRYKAEEVAQHLQLCRPRVVVHAADIEAVYSRSGAVLISDLRVLSGDAASTEPEGTALTGLYMFSSGSTGKSKRITRTQQQVLAEFDALSACLQLRASDCVLCAVPLFHAHGFCNAMLAALLSGATLLIAPGEFNPRATLKLLSEHAVSIFPAVPFMFQLMSDTALDAAIDLSALRWAISAGAALPETTAQNFEARFGRRIGQLYGTTETGAISVQTSPRVSAASVGQPLPGTQVEIRDERGGVQPSGQEGEIWVAAVTMTTAYDDLPDQTAQCFKAGWFFTGDLGHLDQQGDLFITGRKKLLINVAGFKVDPLEVEAVLTRHPAIAEAVVVGTSQGALGEKIKAVLVLREGHSCSEREVTAFVAERLTDYKVPKWIEFVNEIPRNPLGKVLRKDL